MKEILEQYNKNGDLHHFYILEGEKDLLNQEIIDFLEKEASVDCSDHSLFYKYELDKFLVDDSREVISHAQIKTPLGKKMIFVLSANSITAEAQNALLKLFEEPSERTYFFVVLPRSDNLLATFISRAIVVRDKNRDEQNTLKQFREMTVAKRMKFVEDLIKDIKNEKATKNDVQKIVRDLISGLEFEILKDPKNSADQKDSLGTLMKIDDYLNDSGASTKILLERAVLLI